MSYPLARPNPRHRAHRPARDIGALSLGQTRLAARLAARLARELEVIELKSPGQHKTYP